MAKTVVYRYDLKTKGGSWLGNIILTDDHKEIFAITDYGNFNFQWGSTDMGIREFILSLDSYYFSSKMFQGMAYISSTSKTRQYCERYAERILPALKEAIKEELDKEKEENK